MRRHVLEASRAVLPDGDGLRVAPARVFVEDGWIRRVEVAPASPPPPDADRLGDLVLTPAFVDAHTHLALVGLRGLTGESEGGNMVEDLFFRVERELRPDDIAALTAAGAWEALLHGVASVWDHYYAPDAVVAGLEDAGLAGIVAPPLQDLDGPGVGQADAMLTATRRLAGDPVRRDDGIGACVGPHATDTVSADLMQDAAALADELSLPVHLHVGQSLDEVRRAHARHGAPPLSWLHDLGVLERGPRWVLVHGQFVTDAELSRLDARRHTLVHCPHAHARFAFPSAVHAWEQAGCDWVVATDCQAANDGLDLQGELRALSLLATAGVAWRAPHARWRATGALHDAEASWEDRSRARSALASLEDPAALLSRVWRRPGRLHPGLPAGAIAPGHLAHLALWDPKHPALWPGDDILRGLAMGAPTGALSQLMVAGRWRTERGAHAESLLRDGRWEAVRRRAERARKGLLERAGLR